jgi:hypothetical protein
MCGEEQQPANLVLWVGFQVARKLPEMAVPSAPAASGWQVGHAPPDQQTPRSHDPPRCSTVRTRGDTGLGARFSSVPNCDSSVPTGARAYDFGTKHNQFSGAIDVIFRF